MQQNKNEKTIKEMRKQVEALSKGKTEKDFRFNAL